MTVSRNRVSETTAKAQPADRPPKLVRQRSTVDMVSKLATETPPRIVRARRPQLTNQDTIAAAFGKIISKATEQVSGNMAAAFDGGNVDGIHQLRVGLRRVRSVLSLFQAHVSNEAKTLDREAKHVLTVLGCARDLDVFINETLPSVLLDHPTDPGLLDLQTIAVDKRVRAYENVRSMLAGERFAVLLSEIAEPLVSNTLVVRMAAAPLDEAAGRLLETRHKKVLKAGRGFASLSTAKRHKVRIAVKKLRYACDFFQTLYRSNDSQLYLKRLKRLLDDLGRLNDAAMANDLANRLAGKHPDAKAGAALIASWYEEILSLSDPHMVSAWDVFEKTPVFWTHPSTLIPAH